MHRHPDYTRRRLKLLAERLHEQVYADRIAPDELQGCGPVDRIPYVEAVRQDLKPARLGQALSPMWSTWWFRVRATVPERWDGERLDLLWASGGEAQLWVDGKTLQGLSQDCHPDAVLIKSARAGQVLEFWVEAACNGLFGKVRAPYQSISGFVLDRCDLARFDRQAWDLYFDFMVLQALEADPGLDPSWAGELLFELNRFANTLVVEDRSTWDGARALLSPLYARKNATTVHEMSAIGHAHIDTAWLWPVGETWRKCERTFSSQVRYMEDYPEYRFACSQACQHWSIQTRNPELFGRMQAAVARGQFVPVGGTWVEPDCNVPSGESLVRQFLQGQRYFEQTYGRRCQEFWNPDVFGYNGQLPQLMREAGICRFLTQKLSWNRFTKPMYHTFRWEGIDGSEVLAHFPPMDTYNASAEVSDIRRGVSNYKDHDRCRDSFMLFGYGDGGGGPTRRMLEILRRVGDLEGLPRTAIRSSDEFFDRLEKSLPDLPAMVGELYFEYHRGTYTSQAATKRQNRKNEFRLHNAEWLSAVAWKLKERPYPHAELEALWRLLLVNQFHDILPGSSITEVYVDTLNDHADIEQRAELLSVLAFGALGTEGRAPFNSLNVPRAEVCEDPDRGLVWVEVPAYGTGWISEATETVSLETMSGGRLVLENSYLRAELNADGSLGSLILKGPQRETLSATGNLLELYDDHPNDWDAWDIDPFHLETLQLCPAADSCSVLTEDPLRVEVEFRRKLGRSSTLRQVVRLDAGAPRLEFHNEVDWHESHQVLKVAFPVTVRAMHATYEMQFGVAERPTHFNTAADLARFEVPGHRFSDLSEHGFGVALMSDCKYGYSTHGNTMRLTLLRAPKSPDPQADMGTHRFAYAIFPHEGDWQDGGVVQEALTFNCPLLWGPALDPVSWFSTDDANLMLDTVKKAEDSDALVLRLYECHGARGTAHVRCTLPFTAARRCNILEDDGESLTVEEGSIEVDYEPYKLITLKLV